MFRRAARQLVQPLRQQLAQLSEFSAGQHRGQRSPSIRQLFSSAEGGQGGGAGSSQPKSMLDAGATWQQSGDAGSTLGSAAAARMRQVAATEASSGEGAGAGAAGGAGRKAGRSILGRLFDFTLYSSLAVAAAGGIAYSRYSIAEVEQALAEAQQQLQQEPGSVAQQAWVQLLQTYLSVLVPLDEKVREYTDPTCDALLPELAPEIRGQVKTLVLDLEDVLVHKEWSRAKGWQVMKRPGVEPFLLEMGKRYEVVVYTDEPAMYADPVINKIDPHRAVLYRLYRQETQYHNGKHVRDLSKLNRDLRQVLFISANPDAYAFQPENALKVKPWDHSTQDTTLLDLIPFLQMVQEVHVDDVRDVVRSYDGEEDVAAAFKARMARMAAQKQQKKGFGLRG